MVPDNSDGIPRVPPYSGVCLYPIPPPYGAFTLCGTPFQTFPSASWISSDRSYNPGTCVATTPVWALPRSIASTGGIVLTFSSCGYWDVSVPRVRLALSRDVGIAPDGLPHSDIPGSMGICPSPGLFAACHVLPRLREPRHPPCALDSFRFSFLRAASSIREPARVPVLRLSPHVFAFTVASHPLTGAALVCSTLFCLISLQDLHKPYFSGLFPASLASNMSVCSFLGWRITESNR